MAPRRQIPDFDSYFDGDKIRKPKSGRPSWRNRNRVIYATLIFCAVIVGYIVFNGSDTRLYETTVLAAFGLAGSVVGFYIAGATWQDVNVEKIKAVTDAESRPIRKQKATSQPDTDEK